MQPLVYNHKNLPRILYPGKQSWNTPPAGRLATTKATSRTRTEDFGFTKAVFPHHAVYPIHPRSPSLNRFLPISPHTPR